MREKRKTINGDDLLWAIQTLAFDAYVEPLKRYLAKFREVSGCLPPPQASLAPASRIERRPIHCRRSG